MPIYKNNEKQQDGSQTHAAPVNHDASVHLIFYPKNLFIYSYLIEGSNHWLFRFKNYRKLVKVYIIIRLVFVKINFVFFFRESFNLWRPLLMITLYHQTKTPISFWCRRGLNPRSLIQPSETLPKLINVIHQINILNNHTIQQYSHTFNINRRGHVDAGTDLPKGDFVI